MFGVFFLVNLLFLGFLWYINFTAGFYLLIGIVFVFLIFSSFVEEGKKFWLTVFRLIFVDYLPYVNLIIALFGFYFIFLYIFGVYLNYHFYKILSIFACLVLLIIFGSIGVLIKKDSWIKLTFFGFILIWGYLFYLIPKITIFYYFVAFILGVSTFLNLIWTVKNDKFSSNLLYIQLISLLIAVLILAYKELNLSGIGLAILAQILIGVILGIILFIENILKKVDFIKQKLNQYNHELTLFGYSEIKIEKKEQDFYDKWRKYYDFFKMFYDFFKNSPDYIKILFSLTNTVPLVISTYFLFVNLGKSGFIYNEVLYWIGVILFFINFLMFKRLNWFVIIQRFFAFLILNFAIYFTLIDFLGKNYLYLAFFGMIWSLFSNIIVSYLGGKFDFYGIDYFNWLVVNFIGFILNIYFIWQVYLNLYLLVGIVFLYIAVYLFVVKSIYGKIT